MYRTTTQILAGLIYFAAICLAARGAGASEAVDETAARLLAGRVIAEFNKTGIEYFGGPYRLDRFETTGSIQNELLFDVSTIGERKSRNLLGNFQVVRKTVGTGRENITTSAGEVLTETALDRLRTQGLGETEIRQVNDCLWNAISSRPEFKMEKYYSPSSDGVALTSASNINCAEVILEGNNLFAFYGWNPRIPSGLINFNRDKAGTCKLARKSPYDPRETNVYPTRKASAKSAPIEIHGEETDQAAVEQVISTLKSMNLIDSVVAIGDSDAPRYYFSNTVRELLDVMAHLGTAPRCTMGLIVFRKGSDGLKDLVHCEIVNGPKPGAPGDLSLACLPLLDFQGFETEKSKTKVQDAIKTRFHGKFPPGEDVGGRKALEETCSLFLRLNGVDRNIEYISFMDNTIEITSKEHVVTFSRENEQWFFDGIAPTPFVCLLGAKIIDTEALEPPPAPITWHNGAP